MFLPQIATQNANRLRVEIALAMVTGAHAVAPARTSAGSLMAPVVSEFTVVALWCMRYALAPSSESFRSILP